MATIKHLAIKGKSYAFPLRYLTYQYDEKTNQPILDENKHMVLRDEYLIDAIGVLSPSTFQEECENWNSQNHKNQKESEIKLHHYIISFDPKDKELGLTLEKVQAIGMEIANKFFVGCQALICTHPDGHNKSGNMHVHIVVNSVRKEAINKPDFIERESECIAGAKIRASKLSMNAMKAEIMEICKRENLNQIDLINPPEEKMTEREYRKTQREQEKINTENAALEKDGLVPSKTEFQTEKDKIRKTIKKAIHQASDEQEFRKILEEAGITITESRGRWGYKTADLKRTIRARQFGTSYEKEYILSKLGSIEAIRSTDNYYGRLKKKIDVQNAISAADTMNFFVKNGLSGTDELREKISLGEKEYTQLQSKKEEIWEKLNYTNRMIHNTGSFLVNKRYYNAWKQTPADQKEAYETKFAAELTNYKKANDSLKEDMEKYGLKSMPRLDALKSEKNILMTELEKIESAAAQSKQSLDELQTLMDNYNTLLNQKNLQEEQLNDKHIHEISR
ncbi:relaxase/mobilization nuclease domain-containing protein [Butyrivibrio sp. TB]|uniref:relaxase/mobilization nuclease domain-containing protein n=1 Tax=Butyrivibrio sp. TB TaxID=1520809 RepID=UPI0008D8258B|nr:relaxase/mobilization nuclease domain-containing protein [Butyrivibrio sp. TB]SEQ56169.1 Relaxase/Mobilisation nuclease domain-containing protein [Butyrivibrio sp. TB]